MREWSLSAGDPLALRIAADARVVAPDYADDQIWELSLEGGEPPAMSLETTFGLRVRGMKLFPGFGWNGAVVADPSLFAAPPMVRSFYPNYLRVQLAPFPDLDVQAEYWVPESHAVVGRFTLRNLGPEARPARLRLHAVLRPGPEGQVMGEMSYGGATVLSGRSGKLAPVLFLAGGAQIDQAAYPALVVEHTLPGGGSRSFVWAHAGLSDAEASFDAARQFAGASWEAEIARLELLNASLVEVETGDSDWDAALAFAQKTSLGCFVGPTDKLPAASIVYTRLPDRGYSERGDGSDYALQWDGQGAAQAYMAVSQVAPSAPHLAAGLLRNFLAAQAPDGSIDGKPGLAGQRSGVLCAPFLCTLALRLHAQSGDGAFLEQSFTPLLEYLEAWFSKEQDRDQDGHPEWNHTLQSGFDDCPTFVRWQTWGQGLDISKAETPDLGAYLLRECRSLIEIAAVLGRKDAVPDLQQRAARLAESVEAGWADKASTYRHIDRDVHASVAGEVLGVGKGEFAIEVERTFDPPVRVLVRCKGAEGLSHAIKVFIHGRGKRGRGRVERLSERQFQWFWVYGTATSDKTYALIERIEIRGISEEFETEVLLADFTREDQLGLVPLWAGIPSTKRASQLVRKTVLDPKRFLRAGGLASCSAKDAAFAPDNHDGSGAVSLFWNCLVGEGLVEYGYREQAADLVARLMQGVVYALRTDKAFREAYNADKPEGLGERDHIMGIFPLHLFLLVLGVRLITPRKVEIAGRNPYPWPVVVRWRGLEVRRELERTWVIFPDGQRIEVKGEAAQVVEQLIE